MQHLIFILAAIVLKSLHQRFYFVEEKMPRRKRVKKQQPKKKMNMTTTIWYILGALIVLSMVFSLVAGAFR